MVWLLCCLFFFGLGYVVGVVVADPRDIPYLPRPASQALLWAQAWWRMHFSLKPVDEVVQAVPTVAKVVVASPVSSGLSMVWSALSGFARVSVDDPDGGRFSIVDPYQ